MTVAISPILQVTTLEAVAGIKQASAFCPGELPDGSVFPIFVKDGLNQTVEDIDVFAKQGPISGDGSLQLRPTWNSASGAVSLTVPRVAAGLPGHLLQTGQSLSPVADLLYLYYEAGNEIADISLQVGMSTAEDLYGQATMFFPGECPDGAVAFPILIPGGAADTITDVYLWAKQGPYRGNATVEIRSIWNDSGSSKIAMTVPSVVAGLPSSVRVTTGSCTPASSVVYAFVVAGNGLADFYITVAYS